jgi:hypothetical protein
MRHAPNWRAKGLLSAALGVLLAGCGTAGPPIHKPEDPPQLIEVPAERGSLGLEGRVKCLQDDYHTALTHSREFWESRDDTIPPQNVTLREVKEILAAPASTYEALCRKVMFVSLVLARASKLTDTAASPQELLAKIGRSGQHVWVRRAAIAGLYGIGIRIEQAHDSKGQYVDFLELSEGPDEYWPARLDRLPKEEEVELVEYLMTRKEALPLNLLLCSLMVENHIRPHEELRGCFLDYFLGMGPSTIFCHCAAGLLARYKDAKSEQMLCGALLHLDMFMSNCLKSGLQAILDNGVITKTSLQAVGELEGRAKLYFEKNDPGTLKEILDLTGKIRDAAVKSK